MENPPALAVVPREPPEASGPVATLPASMAMPPATPSEEYGMQVDGQRPDAGDLQKLQEMPGRLDNLASAGGEVPTVADQDAWENPVAPPSFGPEASQTSNPTSPAAMPTPPAEPSEVTEIDGQRPDAGYLQELQEAPDRIHNSPSAGGESRIAPDQGALKDPATLTPPPRQGSEAEATVPAVTMSIREAPPATPTEEAVMLVAKMMDVERPDAKYLQELQQLAGSLDDLLECLRWMVEEVEPRLGIKRYLFQAGDFGRGQFWVTIQHLFHSPDSPFLLWRRLAKRNQAS